jgi:hypothetical protein
VRDDDSRVWRANATRAEDLWLHWGPAKPAGAPPHAALRSLRPVGIDVRVEAADGRAATRTITRHLVGPGVKVRRWRDLEATLFLPAEPRRTVVVPYGELAAPLLASRGAIVLAGQPDDASLERLAAVPGAGPPVVLDDLPLPPGIPAGGDDARLRAERWAEVCAAVR